MIEIFYPAKRAILNDEILVGELSDPYDVEEYFVFKEESEVIVLGHSHTNPQGKMYVVYSPQAQEATTIHEWFLDFIDESEGEEDIE